MVNNYKYKEKVCDVCKRLLPREKFIINDKGWSRGAPCRECINKKAKEAYWLKGGREKAKERTKKKAVQREQEKQKKQIRERYCLDPNYRKKVLAKAKQEAPWQKTLKYIKSKCGKTKYNMNTKNFLTLKDLEYLWYRDLAMFMDRPSIDRIDLDGHFTFENCRYIELAENSRRTQKRICAKFDKPHFL